jgi:CheY-like chemotaxis protein
VLLIDDDQWVRTLFTDVLAAMGCHVRSVASGEEGLALFAAGAYQLVITDLALAGVSGIEIVQAVTRRGGTSVIVMTGSVERLDELRPHCPECTVLTKPVRLPDFQGAVRRALGFPAEEGISS